ncbi:hypothetical protein IFM89_006481 [Coptis chinensis]|uniref:AP2/ERF and B3 domain-containing transcription factor n=1 Tax=Coptis chinensis TaxID=261450 RepID=A0A835ILB0_9MAGN|nr:hypothetical protein IFM89_006481 [Coptis chinensis]
MDEELASVVSNTRKHARAEGSESNSSNNPYPPNKRQRQDNSASSSSRFKGVVPQQNGHWGAQIYAKHKRIWLGTFKSENEAGMAYDSAAIKLRSGDSHRNFPLNNITIQEPKFQDLHSIESVLNMIKDGSYNSKFMDFVRHQSQKTELVEHNLGKGVTVDGGIFCHQLFQKELTPSDVGKLNRLVIPKKHAIKYFPHVSEGTSEEVGSGVDDVQLVFFDRQNKSWKFRYCYWKSSQSFVFTRGWNRFVKEKDLKAKDVITFYKCEQRDLYKEQKAFCMIDVGYNVMENNIGCVRGFNGYAGRDVELQLGFGKGFMSNSVREAKQLEEEETVVKGSAQPFVEEKKGFRLFGVQISK